MEYRRDNVMGEVSPDGTLTRTQSFDAYGAVRSSSGTATTKRKFVGALVIRRMTRRV